MLKSKISAALLCISMSVSAQVYHQMAMDTTMSFIEIVDEANAYYDLNGKGHHSGYKSFKRWEYWMKRCLNAEGKMMSNAKSNKEFGTFRDAFLNSQEFQALSTISWEELGPFETDNSSSWSSHMGRITSIAVDASDSDHILVGSPTGGVWQSRDEGLTWVPIFDNESVTKIFSIEINPHNPEEYFVGTWGGGVRRSQDGGATWTSVRGVPNGTRILRLAVHPVDPDIILAINEGGNIFRSNDGGDNWRSIYTSANILYDLEFKPNDPATIYASGINEVLISTNYGESFQKINGVWEDNTNPNPIMMAVTPADPDYIYLLESYRGGFHKLHLSINGGQTFAVQSDDADGNSNYLGYAKSVKGGQAPRDMDIVVSPTDKREVHIGGVMTFRSYDTGINWEQTSHWLRDDPLPFIHADIDIIIYKGDKIYFGTDGGLFISEDRADSFSDRSTGLNIRQIYRMDISKEGIVVTGSQDNGVSRYEEGQPWLNITGADGMEPIIDKTNPNVIYSSIQYGNVYKTEDGGWTLSGQIVQTPGFGDWVTPIEEDPKIPDVLYQGKKQLYKTTDAAWSWNTISHFKTSEPKDTLIQEIDVFSADGDFIICGFEKQVFKTIDGGVSWTEISPDFYFSNVNYISIHPTDRNWIAMTLSGTDKRVVQTRDGGQTWQSIFDNLPDLGTECVIYEGGPKNGMYVSMDPGIYYRNSDYNEWQLISMGVPNVRVSELEIHECHLYACTFGRGLWRTSVMDNSMLYADMDGDGHGDRNKSIQYCSNSVGYVTNDDDCNDSNPDVNINNEGTVYLDQDGDGYGDINHPLDACLATSEHISNSDDCDDSNENINPGASEQCNGLDNNCDGIVDPSGDVYYRDADEDGYGDAAVFIISCSAEQGYVDNNTDCDDNDAAMNPETTEVCDGIDNNCDGIVDPSGDVYYRDADEDGYGDGAVSIMSCSAEQGYVENNTDCDDNDAAINPQATEVCDGIDNNCDGIVDPSGDVYYRDADEDGYGDGAVSIISCSAEQGYVENNTDCDDNDAAINPQATEVCDGIDNNCDGIVDPSGDVYYRDADEDGYGDAAVSIMSCSAEHGYVENNTDCDDNDAAINPQATEVCDGIDNNCDGEVDPDKKIYYLDADRDGHGDPEQQVYLCIWEEGYVLNNFDCDDTDPEIRYGATELCDGKDNNCNGFTDEGCNMASPCDGTILFISNFLRDTLRAEEVAYTDAVISDYHSVLLTAGDEINLEPGFEVKLGSEFEAMISDCDKLAGVSESGVATKSTQLVGVLEELFLSDKNISVTIRDENKNVVSEKLLSNYRKVLGHEFEKLENGIYTIMLSDKVHQVQMTARVFK